MKSVMLLSEISFSNPTSIYLPIFNHIKCRIKCKICSKLTIKEPDVVLVSLLLNLNMAAIN